MAKGEIKPFWATKQHDLRKLWNLFDKFVIYINYFAPFPHVPITILLNVLITKAWPWRVGALSTLHDQRMDWIWLRNGYSGQHVDTLITFSCWDLGHSVNKSPAHPHISVSIWEHLAQNHTMFSKATVDLCQWWWLGKQLENDSELLSKIIM